jgi:hypothetical protein
VAAQDARAPSLLADVRAMSTEANVERAESRAGR